MQLNRISLFTNLVICAVALTGIFIYTKTVLVPFVLALFAYSIVSFLSEYLKEKFNVPKNPSYVVILGLFFLISTLLIIFIANSINQFAEGWVYYKDQILTLIEKFQVFLSDKGFALNVENLRDEIPKLPVFSFIKNLTGGAFSILGNAFLVFIFLVFLLAGESKSQNQSKSTLLRTINEKISKYIITKTVVSTVTGILVGLLLMFCGVELAFMFAVITVLLNFIPNIGSIIATVLPLPIVLLQFGFGWQFFVVLIVSALVQIVIGNVIEPKLMGEAMELHPVTVLVFLMFWGLVWGLPGMFLAVPMTAVIKIILNKIDSTRSFAELLSGRLPKVME